MSSRRGLYVLDSGEGDGNARLWRVAREDEWDVGGGE
ncbi:unnamed protein product, partial [marine sediment metagenome]